MLGPLIGGRSIGAKNGIVVLFGAGICLRFVLRPVSGKVRGNGGIATRCPEIMTSNRDKRIESRVKKRNGFGVDVIQELIICRAMDGSCRERRY